MLITYKTVSEEDIINELQIPSKESTPYFVNIPSKVAREALPDNGRVIMSGSIPDGTLKKVKTGETKLLIKSLAPDLSKIVIPTTNAQMVGSNLHALKMPSFAPNKKEEK